MTFMQSMLGYRRWHRGVFAGALLVGVMAGGATAEDRFYVLRDGRKVPLVKSDTELGVVFRSHAEVEEARQRLEAAGHGLVLDIEGAPGARVKILRVPTGGAGDVLGDLRVEEHPAVEDVQPVYRFQGANSPVISTGTMVVKLRSDLTAGQRESLWDGYGIVEVEAFKGLHDVYVVKAVDGTDEVLLAEQLAGDARTLWGHPNFRRLVWRRQAAPQDEFFDKQWHLDNTGQSGGTENADIDAPEAWSIADGEGVLFGMFDDSCDVDHEDLRDNYIGIGHDPSLDANDEGFNDPRPKQVGDAHGTAVMGLAVAAGNSAGVRGVSFGSRFTVSRGLMELTISDSDVASAYTFALEQGVDIHINSWAFSAPFPIPPVLEDAIETAFEDGRDLDGPGGADPLGMVIVFGTGNDGAENMLGFAPSTLPQVIGVGSSDHRDTRSDFSNYGPELNFLAPGDSFIATTDNEDGEDKVEEGYNVAGLNEHPYFDDFLLGPEIDPTGSYTGNFAGTSAACPIAAGVAGLILSANDKLTATDIRLIMEHTCDKVRPSVAGYNGITNRSLTYGYGRVNAHQAVLAAKESLTNGGLTWPDIPTHVQLALLVDNTLLWRAGAGTDEFLVLESEKDFSFIPEDGVCYDGSQLNCASGALEPLPPDVSVLYVGCLGECQPGEGQSASFDPPSEARKVFAIYGRSSIGRYSFGVGVDSEGSEDVGAGGDGVETTRGPAVTIAASPLDGLSPLTVHFNGNALSEAGIDTSQTELDFNLDDPTTLNGNSPSATYTYEVDPGDARTFTARLTMYDVLGHAGNSEVRIRVSGGAGEEPGAALPGGNTRILVSVSGTPGSDVSQGTSPFAVELRVDADTPGSVQSVVWDLGDGTRATSLLVPHTYINEGDNALVLPITATVTTATSGGTTATTTATRLITVLPGAPVVDLGEPDLPGTKPLGEGGAATPCGGLGMVPLLFGMATLLSLRRRCFIANSEF